MRKVIMTITGPTASGKSTLEEMLVSNGYFSKVISTTTREMREGEEDGVDYHYIHYNDFMRLIQNDKMVESIVFDGNKKCYGIQVKDVEGCLATGKALSIVVEPEGMKQVAAYCEKNDIVHISVFVKNELGELIERFISRDPMMDEDVRKSRIDNLISNEMKWEEQNHWDVIVERFDEDNEEMVVEYLSNMVAAIQEKNQDV